MNRYTMRALVAVFAITLITLTATAQNTIVVSVQTDRDDALYAVGQPVTFSIAAQLNDAPVSEGTLDFQLSNDGWKTLETGTRPLTPTPTTVTGTLDGPGFLWCIVTHTALDGTKTVGYGAAGMDPDKIAPRLSVPDDFDAYWAEKKATIDALPMNPVLTPVDSTVADVECFDVQLECLGGAPVSGYFARPIGAAPKSLAAMLFVQGAGVRSSILHPDIAVEGVLALDINAHGIPNGQPKEFYDDLAKGDLAGYPLFGRDDRETCYFLGMYLRLMRAMNFLEAQPEWDGKVFIVEGTSQGGGQSLVAAGLNPKVTALCAGVPAMCDHTGNVNGWPQLVPRDSDGNFDPKVLEVARYFDAANFATRTTADALISVGFIDGVCRPTSVYVAYNNLPGKKQMLNKPHMNHAVAPEWNDMVRAVVREQIAKGKK